MHIDETIKKRRSVRLYKPDDVPESKLKKVLEAARLAPSARNLQEFKIIVVKDKEKREQLGEAADGQHFIAQAPIVIAAVSLNPERFMSCGVPSYAVDIAITVDHMTLTAAAEGLGTCWIGAFSQEKVKEILGVPYRYKVAALFPLGFAADSPKEKIRKELEELVSYEKLG